MQAVLDPPPLHVLEADPVLLRLIDTPGLDLSSDILASATCERGVAALIRLLEERFEETLPEENKVVRRKVGEDDGLVHLGEWGSRCATR
jgi:hypothetical protein